MAIAPEVKRLNECHNYNFSVSWTETLPEIFLLQLFLNVLYFINSVVDGCMYRLYYIIA